MERPPDRPSNQTEDVKNEKYNDTENDVEGVPSLSENLESNSDIPKDVAPRPPEQEYPKKSIRLLLTAALTLACFLVTLDASIIVTAIPKITNQFHSVQDVGWYGSAYLISSSSLQPLTGKFYNQFNNKYTFMTFIAIFEFGSIICGVAQSSKMFIVGRAIAGLGSSGMVNGALTILASAVPLHSRAKYMGIMIPTFQLGLLFGPLIGGSLTQYTTWRWCFFINLPCGALAVLALLLLRVPDNTARTSLKGTKRQIILSFDLQGFFLFAPTAIMCLLAVQWGGTKFPWKSATIIGLFCGSFVNLILFLIWEQRAGDRAMLPFSMLKQRVVWVSCLYMFFFFGSMMMWIYYLPIYFQTVRSVSATLSGVYMLPLVVGQMIGAVSSGILTDRIGYYLPWAILSGVMTSIASGLMSTFKLHTSTGKWVGILLLGGLGRGLGIQMAIVAIQNHIPRDKTSTAMAILIFTQTFGGALFLSFSETALTTALKEFIPKSLDIGLILSAGATGFREVIPESAVEGVVIAYDLAIERVFYISIGVSVLNFLLAWGMGWKSVKKEKVVPPKGNDEGVKV